MYNQITSNKRKTWILVFLFMAVISSIGWFLSYYFEGGIGIFLFALVFALVTSSVGYFKGDAIALATHKAKPILQKDNPYVYRMVENLAITSGLPMPKVYIIEDPALNAFATGRDPEHASIAFTTGIIEKLENEELEGVAAHELSHIQNYDIRVMTLVIVLVGIITLIGDFFLRMQFYGGMKGKRRSGGDGRLQLIILVIGVLFIILSPIIAELIKLAVSRKREFLADASGSLLTRYPVGLANALKKISASPIEMKKANHATAHLFISAPFKQKKLMNRLFSTHPPVEERISALNKMGNARA